MYHGEIISKASFSGAEQAVTGPGGDTTYSVVISCQYCYILCQGAAGAGAFQRDPELPFFGSYVKKRETHIGVAYPYARHMYRDGIRIYLPSAYVTPIQAGLAGIYFTYAAILPGTLSI